jgi:hypothetical protein
VGERPTNPLAEQLLDAEVRYHLDRLDGDALSTTVRRLAEDLLTAAERRPIKDVVDQEAIVDIVTRSLGTVPGSAAVRTMAELVTTVVHEGPEEPFPLGELAARARVEEVLDRVLALHPVLERALERLTDSPLVATMASRFMGRIAGEVLQANKAVADKVPGLGSLMSFGTSAASRAMGAADKQLDALIGSTVGGTVNRGGTFAVRGLNRIVLETLRDPTTRDALLQVWELLAQEPVRGLDRYLEREELDGVVHAVHELVVEALGSEHVAEMVRVLVGAFFDRFGDRSASALLVELAIDRDDVVDDLVRLAPGIVGALRDGGDLERILRAHLEPFYASPEVSSLLA